MDKKHDKINQELSKAYFGNTSKHNKNEKPAQKQQKKGSSKVKPLVILIILAVIGAGAFYFANNNAQTPAADKETGAKTTQAAAPAKTSTAAQKTTSYQGPASITEMKNKRTFYDFEDGDDGWEIPSWALEKPDHVATSIEVSEDVASSGKDSIKVQADFKGGAWAAALVEVQQFLDLTNYDAISVDVYVPAECPPGLRAKIILTVGEDWKFTEMARSIPLTPGAWTTIAADISEGSIDWKRTTVDKAFKEDVRKVTVRIESNRKPAYTGPIYIDNITVYSKD
jgi:hypothetical protein